MDKTGQMEPVFIRVIFSDGFSCLKQMFDLRLVQVRITLIDKLIEKLTAFPNTHLGSVQLPVFLSHPPNKVNGLANMIGFVELLHTSLPLTLSIIIPFFI